MQNFRMKRQMIVIFETGNKFWVIFKGNFYQNN